MTRTVPILLKLIAALAGVHAVGFVGVLLAGPRHGPVVLLLGVFAAVSAAAASWGIWRLEGWALRSLLSWAFAAPLFAVTLFAALYPERVGSPSWTRLIAAALMWLIFMASAGWQLRSVLRVKGRRGKG